MTGAGGVLGGSHGPCERALAVRSGGGFHPPYARLLAMVALTALALAPMGCGKRGDPISPSAAAAKAAPKPAGPLTPNDGDQGAAPVQRGETGLLPPGLN